MGLRDRFREWLRPTPPAEAPRPIVMVPPELYAEIRHLQKQADWMGRMLEDEERAFTYGEDGTVQFGMSSQVGSSETMFGYQWAYSQCLFRPSYGAAFYINEAQHRIIRARSRAFSSVNPYWHGVQHNLKTHAVGTGHKWTVLKRRNVEDVPKPKMAKVQKELDDFYTGTGIYTGRGGYRQIQAEKIDRKSRDGEYFLQYEEDNKGLRLRFIEPLLVWTPPQLCESNGVWFGIRFARGDYEKPLGYYVRRTDLLGADREEASDAWLRAIPPDRMQHKKVNVDRGTPRGIPDTYWVQARLEQSVRTLKAMGTLVQVRAKIALIRKRINALAGTVQPMLSAQASATVAGPGGQVRNVFTYPDGSILDTNDQAEYQFPGQNIETDKIVAAIQADLQSVATSVGLADYMVSGNLGHGSYATAMVAEGPVVKTFEQIQADMIEEDREVAEHVIRTAAKYGRVDEDTLDLMTVEMSGPPLTGRDKIQAAQANQIMVQNKVKSIQTWQQEEGLDPEVEDANIKANPAPTVEQAQAQAESSRAASEGGSPQPKSRGGSARPFRPDQEPRQEARAAKRTMEEERPRRSIRRRDRFVEHSSDERSTMKPTQEDMAMAGIWLTPEWLAKTKQDILALPAGPRGSEVVEWEYEPGVRGSRLGIVDGQEVWAVDMRAMVVKYNCPDLICAGNSEKWPFIPDDKIVVDWSFVPYDRGLDVFHECIEYLLMKAKWAYARAHRVSNHFENEWLLELRPELAALKPEA
jgi:capsid protein